MTVDLEPVGVVLAGGRSSRLGSDKALLPVPGARAGNLLESTIERLRSVCSKVCVAAGRNRERMLELQRSAPGGSGDDRLEWLLDGVASGPAAGIVAALERHPGRALLALGCDLPGVEPATLERLVSIWRSERADWVVPSGPHGLEPLVALYGPRALECLKRRVERGRYALHRLRREGLVAIELGPEAFGGLAGFERQFFNINTLEDLDVWRVRASRADATRGA